LSHGAQAGDMIRSIGGRAAFRGQHRRNRPNANYFSSTHDQYRSDFQYAQPQPSPDAVQEFKVQTGSYSAEMGGAGGGQINIVTRSAATPFTHGVRLSAHGAMDAYTFGRWALRKFLVQKQFRGLLRRPIVHNKTFFFLNYEGSAIRRPIR